MGASQDSCLHEALGEPQLSNVRDFNQRLEPEKG